MLIESSSRIHSGTANSSYLKTPHLPPLDLTKSLPKSLKASSRRLVNNNNNHNSTCCCSIEHASSSPVLPDTDNKKKSPKNIVPIVVGFASLEQHCRSSPALTIDVLTESGRESKFSLGNTALSRFSIRPSSHRDSCYFHPEKLKALRNSVDLSLKEYPRMSSLDEIPSSPSSSPKNYKLDPIKESKVEQAKNTNIKSMSNQAKSKAYQQQQQSSCTNLTLNTNKINLVSKPVTQSPSKSVVRQPQPTMSPTKLDSSRLVTTKKTATSMYNSHQCVAHKQSATNTSTSNHHHHHQHQHQHQPNQPLIYTMFEGFPQPFTSRSSESKSSSSSTANKTSRKSFYAKKPKTPSKTTKNETSKPKTGATAKSKKNEPKNVEKSLIIDYKSYETEKFESDDDANNKSSSSSSTIELDTAGAAAAAATNKIISSSISLENLVLDESNNTSSNDKKTESSARDFIKSFEEKFFAIYNKFDQFLAQQQEKSSSSLEKSSSSSSSMWRMRELNEQKAQFIDETAKELNENVDLNEISSDPELVQKLKNILDVIRANKEQKKFDESHPNLGVESEQILNKQLQKNSSMDIREIYSIVNATNRINSLYSGAKKDTINVHLGEMREDYDDDNNDGRKTPFQIPTSITNKINTMLTLAALHNQLDDDEDEDNEHTKPALLRRHLSKNDSLNKSKHNSLNGEDEHGAASENLNDNSISYHYDFKYRDKSPINFRMDDSIEFKWKRGHQIGKGAFGSVYQAMLSSTGEIIAVKQIEMEETDPIKARREYESVREEVNILRQLQHDNIVQFMGTMLEGNVVNIFMELIPGGTIDALLKTYGPFEEDLFRTFAAQILMGVNYIHSKNVVHRDIKGKNIMLMSSGIIKLIDFGCAKRLKKNQSSNSIKQLFKSLKGTPYWMSPEVIKGTGHGSKADIWSTGATIFEMATGQPPWAELSPISAIYAIGSGEATPPQLPAKFSEESRDLVRRCLTRDPDARPSSTQLLMHPFISR